MSIKTLSVIALAAGALGLCSAAYADCSTGFYVGGQAGYGKADYGDALKNAFSLAPNHSTDEGGAAGRVYAGYQFNQYFGVETGYTLFSDNTYKASGNGANIKVDVETQMVDALAKVGTPFGNSGFRGDVKGGVAYVMSDADLSTNIPGLSNSGSTDNWDPAAGASVSYNFNRNFAVDVSYLHTFGSGDLNSPNTDLATVGVSYLFA